MSNPEGTYRMPLTAEFLPRTPLATQDTGFFRRKGPDGAQAQERGYLAALESVVRFEQTGDGMTLFNAEGQMAVTLGRGG